MTQHQTPNKIKISGLKQNNLVFYSFRCFVKTYKINQIHDFEEEVDAIQISRTDQNSPLFTVRATESDFLSYLKSKVQKDLIVQEGHFGKEIGILKSKIGLSSSWELKFGKKTVAKAEIKGIQYFNIKIKDRKREFVGKTAKLENIELREDKGIETCIEFTKLNTDDKLDMEARVDCTIDPEALLTFAVALDHKFVFDDE